MQTKICNKCKKEKSLNEFRGFFDKRDKKYYYRPKCRECERKNNREYAQSKIGKLKRQKYFQTEIGKINHQNDAIRYRNKYPKRIKIYHILNNAICSSRIKRQPCIICKNLKSEGHHPDYSKPLEIIWLCRKHHVRLHNEFRLID